MFMSAKAKKFAFKRKPTVTNNQLGLSLGDDPVASSGTSASDYLKAFSNFTNQALQTYSDVSQNLRAARVSAKAPAPPQNMVQRAANFSQNNTKWLLLAAGGLTLALVVPRLMRR